MLCLPKLWYIKFNPYIKMIKYNTHSKPIKEMHQKYDSPYERGKHFVKHYNSTKNHVDLINCEFSFSPDEKKWTTLYQLNVRNFIIVYTLNVYICTRVIGSFLFMKVEDNFIQNETWNEK